MAHKEIRNCRYCGILLVMGYRTVCWSDECRKKSKNESKRKIRATKNARRNHYYKCVVENEYYPVGRDYLLARVDRDIRDGIVKREWFIEVDRTQTNPSPSGGEGNGVDLPAEVLLCPDPEMYPRVRGGG